MDDKIEPPLLTTVVDARVEIAFSHYTEKTSRYRVLYDGQTLIESTDDPEYDACRGPARQGHHRQFRHLQPGQLYAARQGQHREGCQADDPGERADGWKLVPYKPRPDFPVERFAAQPVLTSWATQR